MNKFLLFWLIASISFSFTSCGESNTDMPQETDNSSQNISITSDVMKIDIPTDQWMKLERKRASAIELGVLYNTDADNARGSMTYNGQTFPIEIRLKGKDAQSLNNEHLSYKIKVGKGAFKNMRSFSIHLPEEKEGVKEWVLHQILQNNDLLTPRYGFVKVSVNNSESVVYAWEEHFDKQLIESSNRREGPIVKFDDEPKLEALTRGVKGTEAFDFLKYAEVVAFKQKKTRSSEVLSPQLDQANILMNQLKNGKIESAVDLKAFAEIKAVYDLWANNDVFHWDNLRFYYSPILGKLEPIANSFFEPKIDLDYSSQKLRASFMKSPAFQAAYDLAISKFNNETFIAECIAKLELHTEELKENNIALDTSFLRKQENSTPEDNKITIQEVKKFDIYEPIVGLGIQGVRIVNPTLNSTEKPTGILLRNYHALPIEILGFGNIVGILNDKNFPEVMAANPEYVKKYNTPYEYVYFRVIDREKVHRSKIQKATKSGDLSERESFFAKAGLPNGIKKSGDTLVLAGNVSINKNVLIPEGKVLKIQAGTTVTIESGAFICLGTVIAKGTADNPIVFNSKNSAGFSVMNAPNRSQLSYVSFDGFNTLIYPGWGLTGAVNFYKSDVDFEHCDFINNSCEDGLNVIDSDFSLKHSKVDNTFSDGFDADFSTGIVEDCFFSNTGNDCLDFSGSTISIISCMINHSGVKGISGGEHSTMTLKNVEISNAKIAVASKDLTQINIAGMKMENCTYGFAVFQKKPEYGPASIIGVDIEYNSIDTLQILDLKSKLDLNGKAMEGDVKLDVEALYGI